MCETIIADWPRKHWMPGGFPPLVYYRVYGDVDPSGPLTSPHYRCAGVPDGVALTEFTRAQHPAQIDGIAQGIVGELLRESLADLPSRVAQARNCVQLFGMVAKHDTLNYFRDTTGLVTWLLDNGGSFVFDPQMMRCWPAEQWRGEVFDPPEPQPLKHCVILTSPEERALSRTWFHTRGMRKFGRPDISVHGVPDEHRDAVAELCGRLIVYQADGAVISDGFEIPDTPDLPPGGIATNRGSFDDEEFNNPHLDVTFPGWM
jgi:hypothetical protein